MSVKSTKPIKTKLNSSGKSRDAEFKFNKNIVEGSKERNTPLKIKHSEAKKILSSSYLRNLAC